MIPYLVEAGYRQVLCEGLHVRPEQHDLNDHEIYYRAFIAGEKGSKIVIIPRDSYLSKAQQGGTNINWFCGVVDRTLSEFQGPALVTTLTDGENGGWFLIEDELEQFWGHFFKPYMERLREDRTILRPTSLAAFTNQYPPELNADVETGTWEYDSNRPYETVFENWLKTKDHRAMKDEISKISNEVRNQLEKNPPLAVLVQLKMAHDQILRAEASDNLYYKNGWLWKSRDALARVQALLNNIP
jgi:hypothetical protein